MKLIISIVLLYLKYVEENDDEHEHFDAKKTHLHHFFSFSEKSHRGSSK
jgi:hypothetical protein